MIESLKLETIGFSIDDVVSIRANSISFLAETISLLLRSNLYISLGEPKCNVLADSPLFDSKYMHCFVLL
jgi:hypothetical protein